MRHQGIYTTFWGVWRSKDSDLVLNWGPGNWAATLTWPKVRWYSEDFKKSWLKGSIVDRSTSEMTEKYLQIIFTYLICLLCLISCPRRIPRVIIFILQKQVDKCPSTQVSRLGTSVWVPESQTHMSACSEMPNLLVIRLRPFLLLHTYIPTQASKAEFPESRSKPKQDTALPDTYDSLTSMVASRNLGSKSAIGVFPIIPFGITPLYRAEAPSLGWTLWQQVVHVFPDINHRDLDNRM